MINITSDCDPSLISPDLKCIKALVKNILSENNIKDAELSYIFCNDNHLSYLKKNIYLKSMMIYQFLVVNFQDFTID